METIAPGGRGVPKATTSEGVFVHTVVLVFLIPPNSPPDSYVTRKNGKKDADFVFVYVVPKEALLWLVL